MKIRGQLITTFEELLKQKSSIWLSHPGFNKTIAMGFIMGMQFRTVHIYLNEKRFYTAIDKEGGKA